VRIAAGLAALLVSAPALAAPTLGAGYGEHMVLQRGQPILIAGKSAPGARVSGSLGATSANATADARGSFTLTFPAREATAKGQTLTLTDTTGSASWGDILIGDVWLCSGQSNMEASVARALNTWNELRLSPDDGIRLAMVEKATAATPQAEFAKPLTWAAAAPATVEPFSAACYFMAKQLRADRKGVPIGLIHSNWGGSAARAWLDPQSVKALYGQESLDQLQLYQRDPMAAAQAFVPQWYAWWRANDQGRAPWTNPDSLTWKPVPKISFWNEWTGSGLDTDATANVWLRKDFELTAEQAKAGGTLSIGAIDDLDLTWVNGRPVGYTFGWGVARHYAIPAGYLKPGKNSILVAANNMWDTGGFFAGPEALWFAPASGAQIALGSGWEYSIGTVDGVPPRAPWDANAGLGVMGNRMVAPLGPMRLAGVAWYQGESDVGQPDYDVKLRELFAGWRRQFGAQARMLVVQLADYGARSDKPVASGWAQLRQDQLDGVKADGNAALVTAIDIGEPNDIHPANKNDLGKRLAMAAQGKPMPMPLRATRAGDKVTVEFSGIEGELHAQGGPYVLGVELCGDTQESCRWALPALDGARMTIAVAPGEPATRVRHAWADAPIVNLYDGRGLPAPGFELPITR
jgi:sialate O-acetylesterase